MFHLEADFPESLIRIFTIIICILCRSQMSGVVEVAPRLFESVALSFYFHRICFDFSC